MALQLRRGSDAQRVAITFAEGELVYTTDTKKLYVGDGDTVGGISIAEYTDSSPDVLDRNLSLNSYTINGIGNIEIDGSIVSTSATVPVITVNQITNSSGVYDFKNDTVGQENEIKVSSTNNLSSVKLTAKSSSDLSLSSLTYGRVVFERNDINGPVTTGVIDGGNNYISFVVSNDGNFSNVSKFLVWNESKLGIGTNSPTEKLDVRGNAVVQGYIQFGSLTTIQRNELSPVNGMIIYNTTENKFQGYQENSWINLDSGSVAS
jgi:hypothetical protein